jgi:thymidine kinase
MGSLTVIFGPMFSGKTTRLIQELTKFVDVTLDSHNTRCLLLNHVFDDRNPELGISSHGSSFKGISNHINVFKTSELETVNVIDYDVIGIDEGQFFRSLDIVKTWVNNGKNVILSGLITDAYMNPFGQISTLFSFADNVIQCHSICCECLKDHGRIITPDVLAGMKAPFTYKIAKNLKSVIDVGATDKYIPVCRHHYILLSMD